MLDEIARYVCEQSRLYFPGHKLSFLKSRLETRLLELNLPDLAAYRAYLHASPAEGAALVDRLTTNETSFFRNPKQFHFLMQNIVPEWEQEKGKKVIKSWGRSVQEPATSIMKLRVLCAGCSTGEEPYSVAMTLLEALRYPRAWDIEILAGDISASCIRTAMTGFYEEERLRGLPQVYREKYLTQGVGGATVNTDVKKLIRFSHMNLGDIINGDSFPRAGEDFRFDIIFCRNVMIYFSAASQQQLVNALFRALVPGGYLFTGDAEPLHLYDHEFATVHDAGCLVYKKLEKEHVC